MCSHATDLRCKYSPIRPEGFDGPRLGIVGGTLRRGFDQIHHSPQRLDIAGSVFFHPPEMIVYVLLQFFATVIVLGLDRLAAALVGYLVAFNANFQHWNVRTPQWLGYFIQRPESHCVHHRMGVHYYNYSDFPPWDMHFGTFRNPAKFMGDCGFEAGADRKVGAMLAFADVNAALYGPGTLGAKLATAGIKHGR